MRPVVAEEEVVEDKTFLRAEAVKRTGRHCHRTVVVLGTDVEDAVPRHTMLPDADVNEITSPDIVVYMMMIEDGVAVPEIVDAVLVTLPAVVPVGMEFEQMDEEEAAAAGSSSHWQLRQRRQMQPVPKQRTAVDDCPASSLAADEDCAHIDIVARIVVMLDFAVAASRADIVGGNFDTAHYLTRIE